jgi:hypothetical protein
MAPILASRSMALPLASTPSLLAGYVAGIVAPGSAPMQDLWRCRAPVLLYGVGPVTAQETALRALWNEGRLFFEFVCLDATVVSPGEKDGLDHFLLGDVVEIFVGEEGSAAYIEVHATPTGRQTSYFFRGHREAINPPEEAGEITVEVERTPLGWRAVLSIPRGLLATNGLPAQYEILAGRYDYDAPGAPPVLSCFPPQEGKPDFHRRAAFARLLLD